MLQRLPISAFTMACVSMVSCSVFSATEKTEIYKLASNETVLEIIVVTGTPQQSGLLFLAGNIDRISREDIVSVGAVHPSDIVNSATGVHVQTNNGMESLPSLRSPVLTGPGVAGASFYF